ncbi:YbaN family protein [Azotobacter armeniacus]
MTRTVRESRSRLVRHVLQAVGLLSLALGVIGIFLPLLPTTPFLLLAAACFMRSSRRFYLWLVGHPYLGPWIRDYLDGRGIPLKVKVYAVGLMWASILLSCYLIPLAPARLLMLASAALVTVYILRQKTRPVWTG